MAQWALSLAILLIMLGAALAFITVSKKRWRRRYQANPDRVLLESEQLAPGQQFEFEFLLTFPDEASARRAATRLRAENYATEIEKLGRPLSDLPWDCSAKRWMYPSEQELVVVRTLMNAVAEEFGGKYDDWIALSTSEPGRPSV